MLARLRILNHTPQDGCKIQQYHPTLWASVGRICAQLVVWDNLRCQIFHRNKIDARGSIRKTPNAILWTTSLDKLREVGDKDPSAIIKAWNAESWKQHQIQGAKAQALTNVLGLVPAKIFTDSLLPAVSECGWEKCPWCDFTFSSKRIFPGAAPRANDAAWKKRLTVNETSMGIMFRCQIGKQIKQHKLCPPRSSHTTR